MLENGSEAAVVDELSGLLSYRKLLTACLLFGKRFAKIESERIGVMLPSSIAADIVFFGLQMAGKLPVMMNWTTGPANMAHAVETLELEYVITSQKFVDRLHIEIEGAECIFLEDLKQGIGKLEALSTLASTYIAKGRILRSVPEGRRRFASCHPVHFGFGRGTESRAPVAPKPADQHQRHLSPCRCRHG